MIKNYLKICLRNIKKALVYSFINIFGLALGLTCCILIFLWVHDELGFDRFHDDAERIYRVISETEQANQLSRRPGTPASLADAIKHTLPETQNSISINLIPDSWTVKIDDEFFDQIEICLTTPEFFHIFNFKIIRGDPQSLAEKSSIILTSSLAERLFGLSDPMGKVMQINNSDYQVSGIMADIPNQSHLQFNCMISELILTEHPVFGSWEYHGFSTYVKLHKGANPVEFSQKMTALNEKHDSQFTGKLTLQSLKDIHLHSIQFLYDYAVRGESRFVIIFSALAVLILFIGCLNFMNLSTAKSASRHKEIGLRKVLGADRGMLRRQFFSESILIALLAIILASCFVVLLLPVFSHLTEKQFHFGSMDAVGIGFTVISLTLLTGFLSGIYPAFFLSSFQPGPALKQEHQTGRKRSKFRRILVLFQFGISIFLLISTTVIYQQLHFIRNKDLGYNRDNILILTVVGDFYRQFEAYKLELLANPNILGVARGFQPIWNQIQTTVPIWPGQKEEERIAMQCYGSGYDYFKTWGMDITQGRAFSRDYPSDHKNYLLNETALKSTNFKDPIGKEITVDGQTGRIIGIVKDFHHTSLHNPIQPIIFRSFDSVGMAIKVKSMDRETLGFIESIWRKAVPGRPFKTDIFFSKIDDFYRKEKKFFQLFNSFTVLALFISCLGLFGLASFSAESRTKEFGIRKILGASTGDMFYSLTREFVCLVLLSNLLAWPVSWLVMRRWLGQFSYKMQLSPWPFLLSAICALLIALLTVGHQALKTVRTNPVKSMRYE